MRLRNSAVVAGLAVIAAAQSPQEYFDRAVTDFADGRIPQSVAGFDALVKQRPEQLPYLWQRGIALYYAGRFKECTQQFELHRTVNPDDVENAAWHFLCVARAQSPAKAKESLLPVGPDSRAPMKEVYEMLRGSLTPQQVLAAAPLSNRLARFYALLYTGLYAEALGDSRVALRMMDKAAADEFAEGGYMHMVAKVHVRLRTKGR